jgi:hypothetical protein
MFKHLRASALAVALASLVSMVVVAPSYAASNGTVIVTPADLETTFGPANTSPAHANGKWFFYNDETDFIDNSLGSFVPGPGNPPLGDSSIQISVTGTQRRNIATYRFGGTKLGDITTLKFSTYNPSAGNGGSTNRSAYLNFNVDFTGTSTSFQRRLVFVPNQNGTVTQNNWKEWDAIAGGTALWNYSGATWPITGQPGTTLKTWSQILSDYPNARILVGDSWLGLRVGEPYANGYTENIDAFKFGTAAGTTTFDFDLSATPTSKDDCKGDGWQILRDANNKPFKNQGQCIQFVNTGK